MFELNQIAKELILNEQICCFQVCTIIIRVKKDLSGVLERKRFFFQEVSNESHLGHGLIKPCERLVELKWSKMGKRTKESKARLVCKSCVHPVLMTNTWIFALFTRLNTWPCTLPMSESVGQMFSGFGGTACELGRARDPCQQ